MVKIKTMLWILGVAAALLLIPTGILFYQNQKLKEISSNLSDQIEVTEKHLSESLIRANTERTKEINDLREMSKSNGTDIRLIQKDLDSLGGTLEAVASTSAKTTTVVHNNYISNNSSPSDSKIEICKEDGRPIDIHGYTKTTETINLQDSNGMRIADVSFSAGEKAPWASRVYGIVYRVNNTIGRTPDGQIVLYTELLAQSPEAQPDQTFRIEGIESRILQAPVPDPEFDWWDPAVYLIASLALEVYQEIEFSAGLALGFSVWSYGDNWRFLGISAGYDAFQNEFRAGLIPVLYNVGGPIPFLQDLWLGLDISVSHNADVGIGLIIGTTL